MPKKLKLPTRLIEAFDHDQVVPFTGHDLATGPDQLPSLASLTGALADKADGWQECPLCQEEARCTRPHTCLLTFERAATLYEVKHGRDSLVSLLQEQLRRYTQPFPVHHKLVGLPVQRIVTTAYDELLEAACADGSIPFQSIVQDTDLSFTDPDQLQIIHLYGKLSSPQSLILTEADHAAAFDRNPLIAMLLQSDLATCVFLFLGAEFNTSHFQVLYSRVVQQLGSLRCLPFTVAPRPRPGAVKIEPLPAEPIELLDALQPKIKPRTAEPPLPPLPPAPYKFLDFFTADDRAIFFGRDTETELAVPQVLGHRLTVLYARCGAGKTSLLLAGVIPRLEFKGFKVAYCRPDVDPVANVQQALEKAAGNEDWAATASELILILDQAEELFTLASEARRLEFAQNLCGWLEKPDLSLRVVLSLRVEYLGDLELILAGAGDALANRFRVYDLALAQAAAAIETPAKQFGLTFEPNLLEDMLEELGTAGMVRPAEIQIVCQALCDAMGEDEAQFTRQSYDELGGVAGILAGYLDRSMAGIGDQGQQAIGMAVLKSLVTPDKTKAALPPGEVIRRVKAVSDDPSAIETVLQSLSDLRLLRRLEDGRVELTHEQLIDGIWQWMDEGDLLRLTTRRLLERALSDFELGQLIEPGTIRLVHDQDRALRQLSSQEISLLLLSSIHCGERALAKTWIAELGELDPASKQQALQFLVEASQGTDPEVGDPEQQRRTANCRYLVQLNNTLVQHLNFDQLDALFATFGLDADLMSEWKGAAVRALTDYLARHDRISELLEACREALPSRDWDDLHTSLDEARPAAGTPHPEGAPEGGSVAIRACALRSLVLLQCEDVLAEGDPGWVPVPELPAIQYDRRAVHEMLVSAFTSDEILVMSHDHFPLAFYSLSVSGPKPRMVRQLLLHCETYNSLPALLSVMRDLLPYQSGEFEAAWGSPGAPNDGSPQPAEGGQTLRQSLLDVLTRFFQNADLRDLHFEFDLGCDSDGWDWSRGRPDLAAQVLESAGDVLLWDLLLGAIKACRPFLFQEFWVAPPPRLERAKLRDVAQTLSEQELLTIGRQLEIPRDMRDLLRTAGRREYSRELIRYCERRSMLEHLAVFLVHMAPAYADFSVRSALADLMERNLTIDDLQMLAWDLGKPYAQQIPIWGDRELYVDAILDVMHSRAEEGRLVQAVIHPDSFPDARPAVVLRRLAVQAIPSTDSLLILVSDLAQDPEFERYDDRYDWSTSVTKGVFDLVSGLEPREQLTAFALHLVSAPEEYRELGIDATLPGALLIEKLAEACQEIVEDATERTLGHRFEAIEGSSLSERSRILYDRLTKSTPPSLETFFAIVFGEPVPPP